MARNILHNSIPMSWRNKSSGTAIPGWALSETASNSAQARTPVPPRPGIMLLCLAFGILLQAPVALAQHGGGGHGGGFGGGHFGGGGGHFGGGSTRSGGGHASAPRGTAAPTAPHGITGAHGSIVGVPGRPFNPRSFLFRPRPVPRPTPQPQPIFFVPVFYNAPFFFWGGFGSYGWPSCGPFWGPGCYSPFYGYGGYYYGYGGWGYNGWWNNGVGNWGGSSPAYGAGGQSSGQTYVNPSYPTWPGARDLVELFFKDGTVYAVTDYWLADGQLHYMMLDERGEKAAEHVVPFDALDLQTTVDVNTERGFRFQLRSESMEQYFRNHPEVVPKVDPEAPKNL